MAGETFSFEEAKGGSELVFADRTSKRKVEKLLDPEDYTNKVKSEVQGRLPEDEGILTAIQTAAEEFGVPVEFGLALAQQESDYRLDATNPSGADGLFQFIPATAAGHGLVHGKDTRDALKSARAAMKDFSEQMKKGGPDWAIKHHFAGPNEKLHGSKTRQYLADVQKRAEDIRAALGKEGGKTSPTVAAAESGPETFSFEDALGGNIKAPQAPEPTTAGIADSTVEFLARSGGYAADAIERSWEHVRNRFLTDMGQISPDDPNFAPRRGVEDPFAETRDIQRRKDEQAEAAGQVPQKGFLANLENPVKLLTEDSLPANALEWLTQAGERERVNFLNARKIQQQESIVANPEKYPAVTVKAAKEAIAARKAKQDHSVRDIWNDVKQAAVEDPGKFGAQFVNALMADPEMLLAPQGIGLKVVEGTRKVATGATVANRVTQIADKIIDAGSTGAALNLGIEAASAGSEDRALTDADVAFAAGIGFAASGGLAGLFGRGSAARKSLREGNATSDTLEGIMKDVAQEELATETVLNNPNPTSAVVKHQIEEAAGVKFESDADLRDYLKRTRKEWKRLFEDRDLHGQYQKALAQERMDRRAQLASEAAEREVVTAAEAAKRSSVEAAFAEQQAARTARFQQEFDQALEARRQAESAGVEQAARAEDQLRAAAAKLDEEELFEASLEGDIPAIKRAMNSALRRDSHMRTPKWQRGDVDPKLLARLGVGSLFAGTAYGLADENKEAAAFAGGLAGLMLPGGGNVLRRMRQSGVTTADGDIISLLVKEGKLKPVRDATDQMAREADQIQRAKQGNQQAFKELYEENFPRITRYVKKQLGGVAARLALTPDDVAQEVFIDAFQQLDKFSGDVPFSAYLTRIAKNKAVDAIRQAQTAKGGKDTVTTSMYAAGSEFGDDAAAGQITEGANPLVKPDVEMAAAEIDTPELQAVRQEVEGQLMRIINGLPDRQRRAIILAKVEQYSTAEVAEIMKETPENARQLISRAERAVMEGLEKGYGAKRLVAKEIPEARTEVVPAKRGRGRPRKVVVNTPVADPPFLGYLAKDGSYEGYSQEIAAKYDYHHNYVLDKLDVYDLEDSLKFVRMNGEKDYTIRGIQVLDPYERANVPDIAKLAQKLLREGADPTAQFYVDNMNMPRFDAPYQDKPIGTLQSWADRISAPSRQAGSVDPRLLRAGAVSAMGATAGAFLNEENALLGAGIGALAGGLLLGKGRRGTSIGRQIVDNVDYTLGVVSTRIMNKAPALWRKAIEHERVVLRDTHKYLQAVDPFLVQLQKLPKETNAVLSRAVLTGNPEVTTRLLHAIGDQDLIANWKQVRSTLDSIGDQLVDLKRFGRKELDYFPRIVKDVDGLLKAIGKERGSFLEEALKAADEKAVRSRGTGLTELEKSLVINKVLANEKHKSQQPGFAKNRGIEEITPELQEFYASPTESLHSYIRAAVEDIQRAKFFGKDLEVIKKGGKEFTNVDISIGNTVQRLINEGKLTGKDAEEIGSLLKSRFINGERAPAELIQASKNLSYAGLLGNPISAMTQLGDAIIQLYVQDIRSTLAAVARSATGRKIVDMKDFGLVDHIAEEFVSTSRSAKALNKIFKYGLFKFVDQYGKNISLNAAVTRFSRLAKSEGGIAKIADRYADALAPDEFDQLIKDLRKGEPTDLVRSIAFAELSRTQPITRIELPQAYLDNPNGRLLYQYKTFMIKQIDLARRDGLNEMKKGNVAKGMRNLAGIGLTLGLAGMTTGAIKDFLLGRDVELTLSDIPVNALKTYGLSEYVLDHMFGVSKEEAAERREDGEPGVRATDAEPFQTTAKMFAPPAQMFDHIVTGDPRALRYIPLIGPFVYEQYLANKEDE